MKTKTNPSALSNLVLLHRTAPNPFVRVGPAYAERIGFTNEELGSIPLVERIHLADRDAFSAALACGRGRALARLMTKGSESLLIEWRIKQDHAGTSVMGLLTKGELSLEESLASVAPVVSLSQVLEAMARIVEAKNLGMMCSILLLDDSRERVTFGAGPSLPREYNEMVEGLPIGPNVGSCGTAAFWNIPVIVEDIATDPLWANMQKAAKIAGVSSCWSHPIPGSNGEVLGAIALYNTQPTKPDRHHLDGLEIAAKMVGLAIERFRLGEHLAQNEKLNALGVLAGGIAHDFNNLLTAVLGNAELAMEEVGTESTARPMLDEIAKASVTAAQLCQQMLAYAGRGAMLTEKVECNSLVMEIESLLQVSVAKKAELELKLADTELFVNADRSQLCQVIMNLITNASEAIGEHSGVISIGTATKHYTTEDLNILALDPALAPGDYMHLWVNDTGVGLDTATRGKIFDPFFSTKGDGRGLGLAAVQGIVRRHHGSIALQGGRGAGTRFSVLLPLVDAPEHSEPAAQDSSHSGKGSCILVVDDEPAVMKVSCKILSRAGYRVIQAVDGEEALTIFQQHADEIDCVLLDLSMPKRNGDEVFPVMQEIRPDVRVILSSGYTEQQVMERFGDKGLAGFIQKPARMNDLLSKVEQVLNMHS